MLPVVTWLLARKPGTRLLRQGQQGEKIKSIKTLFDFQGRHVLFSTGDAKDFFLADTSP